MYTKVALMCLVAVALARPDKPAPSGGYGYAPPTPAYAPPQPSYSAPQPSYSAPQPSYEKHEEGMPFDFEYAVKDHYKGVDFDHNSNSDGKVVNGQYRVVLPDGRTQIVSYTADHYNGYQAEVTYEGEAQYPEPQPYKPAPSYNAPAPSYSAPAPSYSAPAPTYEQPKPLYGAPQH
ncbi:cuticle protein 19-like isoform X2 [Macrobrachium nipponense]|uniref:cuticle protein 19-like isoform X2 n=1 Tax=Macrobrachium nipponense TaxID=159736 RepID=UPI0030C80060